MCELVGRDLEGPVYRPLGKSEFSRKDMCVLSVWGNLRSSSYFCLDQGLNSVVQARMVPERGVFVKETYVWSVGPC